jgi:hypothetical protein
MALSLDNVVTVSDSIEAVGVLRREFGIGLFFTNDTTLGTGSNRVAVYSNFTDLSTTFAEGSEPYKAGNAWFEQSPFPRNLVVGRWIDSDVAARLIGGSVSTSVSAFAALAATAYFAITIDNVAYDVNPDLTAVASYSDVATAVQNALTTGGASVSVTYDSTISGFRVVSGSTGSSSTLSYAVPPATGVDLGVLMSLSSSTASQLDQGGDAETISEAINAILALNDSWYFFILDNTLFSQDNLNSVSNYIETGRYMFAAQTSESTVLVTGETSSVSYQLFQEQLQRTWMTYSGSADEYKGASIAARFSSVNFDSANSVITAKFKSLPGQTPDNLTLTQVNELERKRVNYYTNFSTDEIYSEGTCFNNSVYIDVKYALDWFVNAIQVDVYDLLRGSGRVPQTDAGEASIVSVIDGVCRQALTNGMIAPGVVSEVMTSDIIATTGNTSFDGNLNKGYLIWSQPTSAQSQADRAARKATAKKLWLKSSGAIHFVDISILLEN